MIRRQFKGMQVEVGMIFEGKVTGITAFGAFVDIGNSVTGLVHISEVASEYVKDINEHISANDKVKVKVVSIDEKGKIGLSIKKAVPSAPKKSEAPRKPSSSRPEVIDWSSKKSDGEVSFDDMLNKFKQASEEKMHDLKKSMDSKRGSGRRGGSY